MILCCSVGVGLGCWCWVCWCCFPHLGFPAVFSQKQKLPVTDLGLFHAYLSTVPSEKITLSSDRLEELIHRQVTWVREPSHTQCVWRATTQQSAQLAFLWWRYKGQALAQHISSLPFACFPSSYCRSCYLVSLEQEPKLAFWDPQAFKPKLV